MMTEDLSVGSKIVRDVLWRVPEASQSVWDALLRVTEPSRSVWDVFGDLQKSSGASWTSSVKSRKAPERPGRLL